MANSALKNSKGTMAAMTLTDRRQRDLALKAVQARRLTDPLGALGQRRTLDRVEREARLRRGMFAGALAVFAASFGIVAATGKPGYEAESAEPAAPVEAAVAELAPMPANVRIGAEVALPRPAAAADTSPQPVIRSLPAFGNRVVTASDAPVALPRPASSAAAAIGADLASSFAALEKAGLLGDAANGAGGTGPVLPLPEPAPPVLAAGSQSSRAAVQQPEARPVQSQAAPQPQPQLQPQPQVQAPARTRRSHARTHSS